MLVEDDSDGRRYVLKATLAEGGAEAVHAEHLAVRHFRSQDPGLVVPEAIPRLQDHDLVDRTGLRMRLLGWVPGAPLGSVAHLSPTALRGLGRLAARSVTALTGFDHPGLHRHSSDYSRYLPRDASGRAVFWSLVCRQEPAVALLYRAGPGGAGRRRGRAPTAARAGAHPTPRRPSHPPRKPDSASDSSARFSTAQPDRRPGSAQRDAPPPGVPSRRNTGGPPAPTATGCRASPEARRAAAGQQAVGGELRRAGVIRQQGSSWCGPSTRIIVLWPVLLAPRERA